MALDMARGMERDDHFTDRSTLEFVEKFQQRAFEEAEAFDLAGRAAGAASSGLKEEGRAPRGHESGKGDSEDDDESGWTEQEEEEEEEGGWGNGEGWVGDAAGDNEGNVAAEDGDGDAFPAQAREAEGQGEGVDEEEAFPGSNSESPHDDSAQSQAVAATASATAGVLAVKDGRPSELVLRFLPLLSEALRDRLRPEGQAGDDREGRPQEGDSTLGAFGSVEAKPPEMATVTKCSE